MIKVVIVDDHQLIRQGIKAILENSGNIEVIGEAEDGLAAVDIVSSLIPDIVIMDIFMPRLTGIQAIEKITALGLQTKIIALSMYSDAVIAQQALQRGAKAYIVKRSITEELLPAIQAASIGKTYQSSIFT
jgi:DNA-binding NarL/FixJ family response regulator